MSLQPGTRLGPYEITVQIGEDRDQRAAVSQLARIVFMPLEVGSRLAHYDVAAPIGRSDS